METPRARPSPTFPVHQQRIKRHRPRNAALNVRHHIFQQHVIHPQKVRQRMVIGPPKQLRPSRFRNDAPTPSSLSGACQTTPPEPVDPTPPAHPPSATRSSPVRTPGARCLPDATPRNIARTPERPDAHRAAAALYRPVDFCFLLISACSPATHACFVITSVL